MKLRRAMPVVLLCLLPGAASAQSSFMSPDGRNRMPAVTIFCPSGTTVAPCNFGGSTAAQPLTVGGSAISASNRLPVSDSALEALISGGALSVALGSGTHTVGAVSQAGSWSVGLSAGSSAIGTVGVTSLPALPAGGNAIGSVSVTNLPATQAISAAALPLPAGAATSTINTPVAPAAATATNAALLGCQSATSLPSFAAGQQGAVPCDSSGRVYVTTNTNLPTYLQAVSSGGFSYLSSINAASSAMATNVKASAGMLYGYEACNNGSASIFFRIFSLASAPIVGSSTPTLRELVPAGQCARFSTEVGLVFSTGIAFDATGGSLADSDTTSIGTPSTVSVSIFYK